MFIKLKNGTIHETNEILFCEHLLISYIAIHDNDRRFVPAIEVDSISNISP